MVKKPAPSPDTQATQTRRWQPGSAKSADHQASLWKGSRSGATLGSQSVDPGSDQQDLWAAMGMVVAQLPAVTEDPGLS